MKNIFAPTRTEQRVVIFIVIILVAAAFTQHLLETRSRPSPTKATSSPTALPTVHPEEEQTGVDDSG